MRALGIMLCFVLVLTTAPAHALFSLLGFKNSMVEFLLDQISVEGELEITAESVDEPSDGSTAIQGLAVSDSQGVWMTVDSLNFAWNPSRLLRGEVEFSNLEAAGVRVLRKPIVPPSEPDPVDLTKPEGLIPKIAWPRAPLAVRITRMALSDVSLTPEVLGHSLAFDAIGAAQDEGDVQAARLELTRTDAIEGRIAFDYARDFAANTLALTLDAAEAPGGLVATLGGLPMDAPSQVNVEASGPPTDWRMVFDLAVADLIWADGTAAIAYDGPLKVDATFNARPGGKLSPEIAALIGDEAVLRAKATEGANGLIVIEEGAISSPHVALAADGTYSRTTGQMDFALNLDAGPGLAEPFDGVAFDGAGFVGKVAGQPGDLSADGTLALKGLKTQIADVGAAELKTAYRQTETAGEVTHEVSISGQTEGLRLDRLQPGLIGTAETELVATVTGDNVDLETAWLDSELLKASISGTANIATQDAELLLGLSTPDLRPVAGSYGVEAGGQIQVVGQVLRQNKITDATLDVVLNDLAHELADARSLAVNAVVRNAGDKTGFDVSGSGEALRLDRIDARLLPQANIRAVGQMAGTALSLEELRLSSPLLNATLGGDLNTETGAGQIRYDASTAELRPIADLYGQALSGRLAAKGVAGVPAREGGGAPTVKGALDLKTFKWQGKGYGDLKLSHDVEIDETPSGDLDLRLTRGLYAPARVKTGFALEQPKLTLSGLEASLKGLTVKARGDTGINLDGPAVDGRFTIRTGNLKSLKSLTGASIAGALSGDLTLASRNGRQNASFNLTGKSIETDGAKVGAVRLKGSASNVLGSPVLNITANAENTSAGSLSLPKLNAAVKGPLSALDISASLNGTALDRDAAAEFKARVNAANPTIRARVSALDLTLDKDRIALVQPLDVTMRGSVISLKNLDLSLPDSGALRGNLTSYGGPVSADLTLNAPRLGFLKRLADVPIASGSLDLQAKYDTRRGRVSGQGQLSGRGIIFEGVDIAGGLNLATTFNLKGNRAKLDGSLSGSFGDPMRFAADLPVRGGGPAPLLAKRGAVSGNLEWQGQIGDLWALVPAPGHVLTGDTKIDLGVGGDISDPQISGGIAVTEGGYQNLDLGTILTDLKIETSILPGGDLGLSVSASDGAKGTVTTEGRVGFGESGVDLNTALNGAVMVRRDDVTARTGGKIRVAGPMNDLAVTGGIVIEEAEVRLVNNNPPSIVTLGDVLIKGQPEPKQDDGSSSVSLDLSIDSPGRMFVRGRGLDSEWKMGLKVRGDAGKPTILGSIDKVRGQLDLIGKAFDLERGRIFFDGGGKIDPLIDVMMTRKTRDLTGRIVVDGAASDPQLSFRSTPSLPEDEVLPRTLFGKSSQALTGSQAISLGLGIATLMDGSGGTLDKVRGAAGLDSLRIDQDEDGNTSVAAGKEVADGVWVGTKQPLGEGGTSVVVEVEIFEDILVDTEVEAGGDASIGLEWKTDF